MIRAAKAKETDREYLSQLKGFKRAQGVILYVVGGGEGLKKVVYREAQSRGSYLFILHFIQRRYFFRAELLVIDHYRKYPPPPGKYEKLPTCSSPPCRPLNFFIHSEVSYFRRKYFDANANTRKRTQINIPVDFDKSSRT